MAHNLTAQQKRLVINEMLFFLLRQEATKALPSAKATIDEKLKHWEPGLFGFGGIHLSYPQDLEPHITTIVQNANLALREIAGDEMIFNFWKKNSNEPDDFVSIASVSANGKPAESKIHLNAVEKKNLEKIDLDEVLFKLAHQYGEDAVKELGITLAHKAYHDLQAVSISLSNGHIIASDVRQLADYGLYIADSTAKALDPNGQKTDQEMQNSLQQAQHFSEAIFLYRKLTSDGFPEKNDFPEDRDFLSWFEDIEFNIRNHLEQAGKSHSSLERREEKSSQWVLENIHTILEKHRAAFIAESMTDAIYLYGKLKEGHIRDNPDELVEKLHTLIANARLEDYYFLNAEGETLPSEEIKEEISKHHHIAKARRVALTLYADDAKLKPQILDHVRELLDKAQANFSALDPTGAQTHEEIETELTKLAYSNQKGADAIGQKKR